MFSRCSRSKLLACYRETVPLEGCESFVDHLLDAFWQQEVVRDAGNAHAHLQRGQALHRLKKYAEAEKCFQKAAELDPKSAEAQQKLDSVRALFGTGDRTESL